MNIPRSFRFDELDPELQAEINAIPVPEELSPEDLEACLGRCFALSAETLRAIRNAAGELITAETGPELSRALRDAGVTDAWKLRDGPTGHPPLSVSEYLELYDK